MAILLIDDQRNLPADRVARNCREGIAALAEQHWEVLYLDHDRGDFSGNGGRELTGYDVACWLEQNPQHLPDRIEIVTSNPGRRNIELALRRFESEANPRTRQGILRNAGDGEAGA